MSRTTRPFYFASAIALCLTLAGLFTPAANAASISYGNFGPVSGVSFLNVTESSATDPVPLFGPPAPFAIGLDFNPLSFAASATNGGADITDGQLNFTVQNGAGILSLSLFEAGDYSLTGLPLAPTTQALAGAIIRATVTQINGVNVAPIPLAPVNASVGFNLLANAGVAQPWSLGLGLNVDGQLGAGQNATRVDVVIDNTLIAISQPGTVSFIAKKEFIVDVDIVPEPTSLGLVFVALCGLGISAARKSA
jgi:hypothetical protein